MSKVLLFTGFERFWHWVQALLIFALLFTGLAVHGTHQLLPFEQAYQTHLVLAWILIGLWVLAIFWHFTTGAWRQYVPTHKGLMAMVMYYAYGIFSGETKPYRTLPSAKHNPLQRLAYLGFKLAIAPAIWISGLLLMFYATWKTTALGEILPLGFVAWVHLVAAFALMIFVIGHVYMSVTTGKPWYEYLKAMITGYEELEDQPATAGSKAGTASKG
jgi:thiosulfate reductase cytochrome b subunit